MSDVDSTPWYRQFWPWFIMFPPAAAVIGGFATLILAWPIPSMVVDDYSEISFATELSESRDRQASLLGLKARIELTPGEDFGISVSIDSDTPEFLYPGALDIHFIHPTNEDLDRMVALRCAGKYCRAPLSQLASRFYIQVSDESGTWRLVGEMQAGTRILELRAQVLDEDSS